MKGGGSADWCVLRREIMPCGPWTRSLLVVALVLLQVIDFAFTWRLLTGGPRDVYEANPVARAILESAGWAGMALFKASVTAVALACVLLVARLRPRLGTGLLAGLCLMVTLVVGQG